MLGRLVAGLLALLLAGAVFLWVARALTERAELKNEIVRLQKLADTNAKLAIVARQAEDVAFEKLNEVNRDGEQRSKELQAEIARSQGALRACRIDAGTLRVLNRPSSVAGTPAAAPVDRSAGAPVETGAGTTCEAVVTTFDENHRQYDLVAVQLNECRAFYNRTRAEYCKLTGAC